MNLRDAEAIIEERERRAQEFIVCFERLEGSILCSDCVPAGDEPKFKSESEAWSFARKLAMATRGRLVNFYVACSDWRPVDGYKSKYIENR